MAKTSQRSSRLRTTKSMPKRPMTPLSASVWPTRIGGLADGVTVALPRREAAAEIRLPARAAEDLVVRREEGDLPRRLHEELSARRVALLSLDQLLRDSPHPGELLEEGLGRLVRDRELQTRGARRRWPRAPPRPDSGRSRFPRPRSCRSASRPPAGGPAAAGGAPRAPGPRRPGVNRSSKPAGSARPASRNAFRLPDFVPRWVSAGSQPKSGMPRRTESFRSRGVELKTVRKARDGSWMPARIRSIRRGRSRIFSVSERPEPSNAQRSVSRLRAWLAGIPARSCR